MRPATYRRTSAASQATATLTISARRPASCLPIRRPAWLPPLNAVITIVSKSGARSARRPGRALTGATVRQQLDWRVPQVIRVSAPWASASPIRNSSVRTLLPLSSRPVRSSRLTQSSTPTRSDRRSSLRIGVGVCARSTRGMGGDCPMDSICSGPAAAWQGLRRRRAEEPPHHPRVAHRVVAVVVVEGDDDPLALGLELLDLGPERLELRLGVEVVVLLAHARRLAAPLAEPALRVPPV